MKRKSSATRNGSTNWSFTRPEQRSVTVGTVIELRSVTGVTAARTEVTYCSHNNRTEVSCCSHSSQNRGQLELL